MSGSFDRKIHTLKAIGHKTSKKGVKEIHETLQGEGFDVNIRTLQRDIQALAKSFDIANDGNKDKPGWYWKDDAQSFQLPGMKPSVALTFKLAEEYLKSVLPPETLQNLNSYFKNADTYLKEHNENQLSNWNNKVAIVSRKYPFITPDIDQEILVTVYEALLQEKQIKAHYCPKDSEPRDYSINPLGIVVADNITYLACTLWDYTDVIQLALHRFVSAEKMDSDLIPNPNFDLRDFIQQGGFLLLNKEEKTIELVLRVSENIAAYIQESALSENQHITNKEDGSERPIEIKATVLNSLSLKWWISNYGAQIEVIEPVQLREEFVQQARHLYKLYNE